MNSYVDDGFVNLTADDYVAVRANVGKFSNPGQFLVTSRLFLIDCLWLQHTMFEMQERIEPLARRKRWLMTGVRPQASCRCL